jgi:hypothetical protein
VITIGGPAFQGNGRMDVPHASSRSATIVHDMGLLPGVPWERRRVQGNRRRGLFEREGRSGGKPEPPPAPESGQVRPSRWSPGRWFCTSFPTRLPAGFVLSSALAVLPWIEAPPGCIARQGFTPAALKPCASLPRAAAPNTGTQPELLTIAAICSAIGVKAPLQGALLMLRPGVTPYVDSIYISG